MINENYIRQSLYLKNLPFSESDVPHICYLLNNSKHDENAIHAFPYLKMETPITIVDKELMV